jgi:hypothetical protein
LRRGHSQVIDFLHRAIWHMDCSLLFNKLKGRSDDPRCAVDVNCLLRMSCRQNLTSIGWQGRTHNQNIRVVGFPNARGDPRAFPNGMEQQDGAVLLQG